MKIYLAGYYNGKASAYAIKDEEYSYFLESYHYINNDRHCRMIRNDERTIFLDSGAFSMFTQKVAVNLDAYAEFIKRNADIIHVSSNLDEIGQGKEQKSWNNQKYLEGLGVKVQPVFHVRDRDEWLVRYLEEGYDYLFIGGMVPETTSYLTQRLDYLWHKYLTTKDGKPKIKVHGFGLTVLSLMHRYPWYSVDSTSWVLTGRFGSIYVPLPEGKTIKVCVSSKSPRVKDYDVHYRTLAVPYQRRLNEIFESRGYTAQELQDIYWKRDLWNIAFFKDLCDGPSVQFRSDIGEGLFSA